MTPRIRNAGQAAALRAGILDARRTDTEPLADQTDVRGHHRLYARAFIRTRLAIGRRRRAHAAIAMHEHERRR
jgi:hypothetical protein